MPPMRIPIKDCEKRGEHPTTHSESEHRQRESSAKTRHVNLGMCPLMLTVLSREYNWGHYTACWKTQGSVSRGSALSWGSVRRQKLVGSLGTTGFARVCRAYRCSDLGA